MPATRDKCRKAYQWANYAIEHHDKRGAEGLCLMLDRKYGLSQAGINEYLQAHGVDLAAWDELLRNI